MKKPSAVAILIVLAQIVLPAPSRSCGIALSIWSDIGSADVVALVRIERLDVEALSGTSGETPWSLPRRRSVATLRVLDRWKGNPPASFEVDLGEDYAQGSTAFEVDRIFVALLEPGTKNAARLRNSQASNYEVFATLIDEEPGVVEKDPGLPQSHEELEKLRQEADAAFEAYDMWMRQRWSMIRALTLEDYPEGPDRQAFVDLVRLAIELQADGADVAELLEWHVQAAERRSTRYEGLIELSYMVLPQRVDPPETSVSEDGTVWYPEESWTLEYEPPARLSQEQLRRLAAGFVREQSVNHSDLTMLRILAPYPDVEVDSAAASVVEAGLLIRPIPSWVTAMVEEVLKRYGDNFVDRIGRDDVDPRGRPISAGEGENTLPTIWEVARRELGIPQVPPAAAPVPEPGSD